MSRKEGGEKKKKTVEGERKRERSFAHQEGRKRGGPYTTIMRDIPRKRGKKREHEEKKDQSREN